MDITCLSASMCKDKVQGEVQVKLLKEAMDIEMDIEKDVTSRLLRSMGIGGQIDIVA